MAQDIVVRYRLELDEALKKLDAFARELEQTDKSATKSAKSINKTADSADKLGNEVSQASKQIKDSTKNVDDFGKKGADTFNKLSGSVKNFALGAGAAIAAAFSVDAIVQFGKASIDAFLDAEKNAERLRFAITTIGGESEAAFQRLIDQSADLQKITVFDDDSIQQAQAALAAFGLTANEIERIIPKLADFATVAGTDLAGAVNQLGAGLEGAGREFKKYGIEVSATATRQQNLNSIISGFDKFAGAAEDATKTLGGQLAQLNNEAADLQESIGSKLAPAFVSLKVGVFDLINTLIDLPSTAATAIEGLFSALSKGKSATTIAANSYDDYEKAIRGAINATNTLEELEDVANKARVDQTKNVAKQQALITKLEENALEVRQRNNKETKESLSLQEAANIIRGGNLQNEINKLKIIDKIEAERRATIQKNIDDELALKLEAQKKLDKANAERLAKELADFEDFKRQLDRELDDLDKQLTEKLKALKPTADDKLRLEIEFVTATQGEDIAFTQVRDQLFAQFQAEALAIDAVATDTEEANLRKKISYENYINRLKELFPQLFQAESDAVKKGAEVTTTTLKASTNEVLNTIGSLVSEIANITDALAQGQIDDINRQKDAQILAIDQALEANDIALEKRRISERQAADNEKKLLDQKVKAEEAAAKKEREIKRRQAILDKAAALVQIAINTAINVSSTKIPLLAALYIAQGAAQAAAVAAQPIPYAKGTKRAKEGLARVGEQGEEIMYVPNGTKVLPNRQTNRYGEVLDAMFDNRFEDYVSRKYIAPALMKEKARRETNQQRSFAENIVQSAMVNPQTGLTYYDMEQIRKKGTRLTDDTIERLADALTRRSTNDIYRR